MDPVLSSSLLKVAMPLIGSILIVAVGNKKGLALDTHYGLRRPLMAPALLFLLAWAVLMAFEEFVGQLLGVNQAKAWPAYPALIVVLRIVAIGLLGPLAEELAVRGLLFGFLQKTKMGPYGAIVLTSLAWTLVHVQYDVATLAFIFVDGLVLGLARYKTGSLYVPIAMHMAGNLFSIYQSLHH